MRVYGIGGARGWRRSISRWGSLNKEQSCENKGETERRRPRTVSPRREIVLYSKSHACLISQNYGSSCSSFNGSSVATWSSVFRFFRYASGYTRCVNIARAPLLAEKKIIIVFSFFSFFFAKKKKNIARSPLILKFYYENTAVLESRGKSSGFWTLRKQLWNNAFWSATPRSFIEHYIKAAARRLRYSRVPREKSQIWIIYLSIYINVYIERGKTFVSSIDHHGYIIPLSLVERNTVFYLRVVEKKRRPSSFAKWRCVSSRT